MIDLSSETSTRPTDEMRAVTAATEVGDDVYVGDAAVNELEPNNSKDERGTDRTG